MQCDFLIVGGGSAGAILGRRLAEANIGSVLLVEAGPSDRGNPSILNLSLLDQQDPDLDWGFTASPIAGEPQKLQYLRAKMLGGCGGHNDCAFVVPPDGDLDQWESLGATGWSAKDVAPYFSRIESMLSIETNPPVNPVSECFLRAGNELGLPTVNFRNGIMPGVGPFPLNALGDNRHSSSVRYLHSLDNLPDNLQVVCNTRITQILTKGGRVTGAATDSGEITVLQEVILSCGSIQSPQLMMVSGIGPASHLARQGIEVVADIPGVGQHLLDHTSVSVIAELREPVPIWELTPCEVSMMLQLDPDQTAPDLLYHFVLRMREKHVGFENSNPIRHGVKISPNVTRPKSYGALELRSPDILDNPIINLNYFSDLDNYDMETLIKGVRFSREILNTNAFKEISMGEVMPGTDINSDAEIADYIRNNCETVYHPAGTCMMGNPKDIETVVAPDLKVKGMDNLRVCDASVFPSMVTVNINNTVMMVAEKAADIIASQYSA